MAGYGRRLERWGPRIMLARLSHRVVSAVVVVVGTSLAVFALISFAPGDAAASLAGEMATTDQIERIRRELGLDDPLPAQFGRWAGDAIRGDLGSSLATGESVGKMLTRSVPVTLSIVLLALLTALAVGTLLAVVSALRPRGIVDRMVTVGTTLAVAVPSFWLGLLLVSVFAVRTRWLPATGYSPLADGFAAWLEHVILPAAALSTVLTAEIARQLRTSLQEALNSPYVLAARAQGAGTVEVVIRECLRNSMSPVVAVLGVRLSQLIAGTVVIEQVFNLQGLGSMTVRAVLGRDIPVVLGMTVFTAIVVLVLNVVVEILHPILNPRLRTS